MRIVGTFDPGGPARGLRFTVLAAALAVTIALPAAAPAQSSDAQPAPTQPFTPTKAQWASLKFATVEPRDFRTERMTEGSIASDDDLTTPVFSPYSGRVVRLIAGWGDAVAKGAPLFAVEATEYVQAVNDLITAVAASRTAHSQLAQAKLNERRNHDLYLAQGAPLKDWQQSQTDLRAAQNSAEVAEIALAAVRNRLRILGRSEAEIAAVEGAPAQQIDPVAIVTAPIAGIVTQRQVGVGQYINSAATGATNPVYTIADLSTVWLVANVREADAALIRPGTPVEVRVPAHPGRVFDGRLSWIAASIDPATHRLSVRADVKNADGALKPGMFASFTLLIGDPSPAPAVPESAIVYDGDAARVWVSPKDGELAAAEIKTGRSNGRMVEVLSGLSVGDKIVTSGTLFIDRAASGD